MRMNGVGHVFGFGCALLAAACSGDIGGSDNDTSADGLTRQCAASDTVKGIDVSKWQGDIDWTKAASDGIAFAFTRVSYGTSSNDSKFGRNWAGAGSAGLYRGAYQYFRAGQDAAEQANKVVDAVGVLGNGDLPVVLDIEEADDQSSATVLSKIREWLLIVEAGTGKTPIIYTGGYFWNSLKGGTEFAKYPLWIANYGASCPKMASGFSKWSFWQYSDEGSVSGISGDVDLDVFNGSLKDLAALAGPTGESAVVVAGLLNLREGSGTSHPIITQMECGSELTILEHDEWGWARVRYGATEGWCNESYLIPKSEFDAYVCY